MVEHARARRLDIVELGPVAARTLRPGAQGTVKAVFERSFYAVVGGQWVCIGANGIGAGPLNAVCAPATTDLTQASPILGERVAVGDDAAASKRGLFLSVADARAWRAASIGCWNPAGLAHGLASLQRSVAGALPEDGLAPLLANGRSVNSLPRIAAAALAPSRHLEDMIAAIRGGARVDDSDVRPLIALLGLGPGLTPSGDDFIGGAMIALHLLEWNALRDRIWLKIAPHTHSATNEISRAHLQAAAEGCGGAALHEMIGAVMTGSEQTIATAVRSIDSFGHTSGWDALAGAVVVLRAWLGVPTRDSHVKVGGLSSNCHMQPLSQADRRCCDGVEEADFSAALGAHGNGGTTTLDGFARPGR